MFPNEIPSALHLFNQETIEKKNNCREILGLKKVNNSFSGLYGVDFFLEDVPVNKNNYVPCSVNGCSFRGPASMMEFHNTTVHEAGLDIKFDTDTNIWIGDRKKNFPNSTLIKTQPIKPFKPFDNRNKTQKNPKQKNPTKQESNKLIESDPLFAILEKKTTPECNDLLGLGALYGSSDEEEITQPNQGVNAFSGLPAPSELPPQLLLKRRNKFKFPILPQMELQSKRNALMNPQRRYHETFNRKAKRPRLADLLLAEDIISERNMVLQCIRYIANKRFFDPSLQSVPLTYTKHESGNNDNDDTIEEEFFTTADDGQSENIDSIEWSDNDGCM